MLQTMMKPLLLILLTVGAWLSAPQQAKAETTWSILPTELILPMHSFASTVADGATPAATSGKNEEKPFNLASAFSDVVFTLSMGLLTIVFLLISIIFVLVYSLFKHGKLNLNTSKDA